MMPEPLEISAHELKRRLDSGERIYLLDCREPHEHKLAFIAGAEWQYTTTRSVEALSLRATPS